MFGRFLVRKTGSYTNHTIRLPVKISRKPRGRLLPSFLGFTMTYITAWEEFAKKAESLYMNDPSRVISFFQ